MENMIKKIVDADEEAKAMEQKMQQEKDELNKEIKEETEKIYAKYMNDAYETVKRNDVQEEKRAAKQLKEINAKQSSVLIKLQSNYERNCDKWCDQIVERTLK